MKICKACMQEKPFDTTQATYSKASGFHGATCWDCYKAAQRARMAASPEHQVLKAQLHAIKLQLREARRAESDRRFRIKNAEYLAHLEQVLQLRYGAQNPRSEP